MAETIVGIVMLLVALLFVGIALHAGRDRDSQRGK